MSDLISREDALVQMDELCRGISCLECPFCISTCFGGCKVFEFIKSLPTIEAEPRWIPCSERLPEEYEEVNITWVNTDPERYYADIKGVPFVGSAIYCKGRWYWYSATCKDYLEEYGFAQGDEMDEAIKVTAWMPLPKPYKMDEVDNET